MTQTQEWIQMDFYLLWKLRNSDFGILTKFNDFFFERVALLEVEYQMEKPFQIKWICRKWSLSIWISWFTVMAHFCRIDSLSKFDWSVFVSDKYNPDTSKILFAYGLCFFFRINIFYDSNRDFFFFTKYLSPKCAVFSFSILFVYQIIICKYFILSRNLRYLRVKKKLNDISNPKK